MKVRDIIAEDFVNYKYPSMFIITTTCDWKCCIEAGRDISMCQNVNTLSTPIKDISDSVIYNMFVNNPITKSIVVGGLEPFQQFDELFHLIDYFRSNECACDFVIYTGYNKDEIESKVDVLKIYQNVVIKYGRYIPDSQSRFDGVLGINLASDNQYAERIS